MGFSNLGKGGGGGGGGVDQRVDELIKGHHTSMGKVGRVAADLAKLRAEFDEHIVDKVIASVPVEIDTPPPVAVASSESQIISHTTDHHHHHVESLSAENLAQIEEAVATGRFAMEMASSSVLTMDSYTEILDKIEDQLAAAKTEYALECARSSNDLTAVQEEMKKQLNRICLIFGTSLAAVTGVAILVWIYNAI